MAALGHARRDARCECSGAHRRIVSLSSSTPPLARLAQLSDNFVVTTLNNRDHYRNEYWTTTVYWFELCDVLYS
jgi:hypothetical protein